MGVMLTVQAVLQSAVSMGTARKVDTKREEDPKMLKVEMDKVEVKKLFFFLCFKSSNLKVN